MKVFHLISGSEGGGSRDQVISLICELNNYPNVEVTLISLMEGPLTEEAREKGLPLRVFSMNGIFDLKIISPLIKYIAEEKPDIFHTHGVRANFIGRLAYKFMISEVKPVLFTTVHSSIYHDYKNSWKRYVYPYMEKSLRKQVDHFITVSHSLQNELLQDGVDENSITHIPNGVYPEKFDVVNTEIDNLYEEFNISNDAKIVMSVGRLVPVKGQANLLKGFKQFLESKKTNEPYYLILVGDGPELKNLQQLASDLSIRDQVIFTGYRTDVAKLLKLADVFVLSSLMEGLPIILLEVMSAGVPIIATEVGGVFELIDDNENGLLIPKEDSEKITDSLTRIFESKDLSEYISKNAKIKVNESYHFSKVVSKTLELYQEYV
ncbi:glycosyltransferase [Natranaerobius trueperi]|uniref:Glycosyl transferase n=1 Tax=Natranaerobius trueperi TaxID=759412 RepID=A0A226C0Z6_9FIRM|nr:glycosyltransferase [Natranaerobius trueperi]OWZ84968.1 hypothetical protein CDO51_00760 [Natranaerobius trueperi]